MKHVLFWTNSILVVPGLLFAENINLEAIKSEAQNILNSCQAIGAIEMFDLARSLSSLEAENKNQLEPLLLNLKKEYSTVQDELSRLKEGN